MQEVVHVIKLSNCFIEPSCSYVVKSVPIAYSSSFYNIAAALTLNGFNAKTNNIKYPLGQVFKNNQRLKANTVLKERSFYSILNNELRFLRESKAGEHLLKLYGSSELIVILGGLFADIKYTSAVYAISQFLAEETNAKIFRIGNFAFLENFFAKFHSKGVTIHNSIDTDLVAPTLNWVIANSNKNDTNKISPIVNIPSSLTYSTDLERNISIILSHHTKSLSSSHSNIFSEPLSLKQRVLTIGFGCPQSCSFCPSRLTTTTNYDSLLIFSLLKLFSRFSPKQSFLIDFLHADPLTQPNELLKLAEIIQESNQKLNHVARIQTRVAFLKGRNYLEEFKQLKIGLIYLGIETINKDLSKSLKKYNNLAEDFIALAKEYKKEKIYIRGNFIFGLPGQTSSELEATYDFIKDNPLLVGNIAPYRPIPGTPDGDMYINNLSSLIGNLDPDNYPKWYEDSDYNADIYCRMFMSRYDQSLDSLSIAFVPKEYRQSYAYIFKEATKLVSDTHNIIVRRLIK